MIAGAKHTDETRAKMSLAAKRRPPRPHSDAERARNAAWHRGRRASPETIAKLRQSHLGKTLSPEARAKLSARHRGSRHWNWQGGKTANRWGGVEYFEWKRRVHRRDESTCTNCEKGPLRGRDLQADHLLSYTEYPEYRYFDWNGRTLCEDCHKRRTVEQRRRAGSYGIQKRPMERIA